MITEGKSPVVMGIREPHTHTHRHTKNSHLDLYDSNLKGIYDKVFVVFFCTSTLTAVKVPDIRHTCYNKQPALQH